MCWRTLACSMHPSPAQTAQVSLGSTNLVKVSRRISEQSIMQEDMIVTKGCRATPTDQCLLQRILSHGQGRLLHAVQHMRMNLKLPAQPSTPSV